MKIDLSERDSLILARRRPADQHPAAVYLATLAKSSRRPMGQALDVIAGLLTGHADRWACNWGAVRFQHVALVQSQLAEAYAPATTNRFLSALRGTLKAAWRLGLMSAEDYHKASSARGIRGETLPAGRDLESGELAALMQACENDTSPAGARDAAMIATLYGAGLRRAELVGLDLANYDVASGGLKVTGKGSKERSAYLPEGATRAMADWLAIRGSSSGPLFWHITKGRKLVARRLTTQAVYHVLAKRAAQAGVKSFSPHDFRRTWIGDLLDAGADIATVAKMAGHANVGTTARYDRRPEQAKQKAAGLLHVPYRGRLV